MGRKLPRHWDMTNFRISKGPSLFTFVDIYESVLSNGPGGCVFNGVCVRNPQTISMKGDQNGIQRRTD